MAQRYLYQNMIGTGTVITPSSQSASPVNGAVPRVAAGSGSVVFSGDFTGSASSIYQIVIDAGGNVGVASFKWRKSETAPGIFEASGVLTSLTNIALDSGVQVRFVEGPTSPSFAVGDTWQVTAAQSRGPKKIFDRDPGSKFRTGTPPADPETIVFDLGVAKAPDAMVLLGHNISSGAVIKIQGNAADTWGAPSVDETLSWQKDKIVHYLAATPRSFRYWRLSVAGDAANPDGWIEAAEVFLGGYFQPVKEFSMKDTIIGEEAIEETQETEGGSERESLRNRLRVASLSYPPQTLAEIAQFRALYNFIKDKAAGRSNPFFLHLFHDDPAEIYFMRLSGTFSPEFTASKDYQRLSLNFRERLA